MALTATAGRRAFQGEGYFFLSFWKAIFSLLHFSGSKPAGVVGSRKRVIVRTSVTYVKLLFVVLVPVVGRES